MKYIIETHGHINFGGATDEMQYMQRYNIIMHIY